MSLFLIAILVAGFFGLFLIFINNCRDRKSLSSNALPPGPPADPIIGHIRCVPSENQGDVFHQWAKVYGDVIHLHFLGKHMVVLDSMEAAHELLDKRSANYSCRPNFVVFEMMGFMPTLTLLQYGPRFHKHRKWLQQYLGRQESLAFLPIQTEEARALIRNMIDRPDKHAHLFLRFATSIMVRIAFGHRVTSDDDKFMEIGKNIAYTVNQGGPPGNTPVDFFPWCAYYGAWARTRRWSIRELHEYPFQQLRRSRASDEKRSIGEVDNTCFLSQLLDTVDDTASHEDQEHLDDIKGAAAVMYGAGVDTADAILLVFLIAMILHPECQRKAQEEIDRVVGNDRLPEYCDRSSLPYVECILQETLRWNTVVPLGVPHRSIEDDVYKGMFIPKGTIIFANARGMSQDENVYSESSKFNPSRFLPKPEGNGEPHFIGTYGFGRRVCPGRHLGDATLWLGIASILSVLNIRPKKDRSGRDILPEVKFTVGIVNSPVPFECDIRPRSEKARMLAMSN